MTRIEKLRELLSILRSFTDGEHPILDHKEKYEFNKQDHHWHLKRGDYINSDGYIQPAPALFEHANPPSELAEHEFHKAKAQGWNIEGGMTDNPLLLPPSDEKLQGDLERYLSAIEDDYQPKEATTIYAHGHVLGFFKTYEGGKHLHPSSALDAALLAGQQPYMEGFTKGMMQGLKAQQTPVFAEVEMRRHTDPNDSDLTHVYGNAKEQYLARLGHQTFHKQDAQNFQDYLEYHDIVRSPDTVTWQQAQEIRASAPFQHDVHPSVAKAWAEDLVQHPPILTEDDIVAWAKKRGIPIESARDKSKALAIMQANGLPVKALSDWQRNNLFPSVAKNSVELEGWLDQNHPDWHSSYAGFTRGVGEAEAMGGKAEIITPLVNECLNKNKSEGGVVRDGQHAKRSFALEGGAADSARKLLGIQGVQSFSDALKAPGVQRELTGGAITKSDLALRGITPEIDWASHDKKLAEQLFQTVASLDSVPPDQKEQFFADAGRYLDKCTDPQQARLIINDDSFSAIQWLEGGAYQYKRLTSVPGHDMAVRTKREDCMGIGRVNYAALGFEASLIPILSSTYQSPKSDLQSGRVADFRTQGYGDARFAFTGVENCSHAVNDTYYDPRYCPDGGGAALIPNAISFAANQVDTQYLHSYRPNMEPSPYGPNFLEMHPKEDLETSRLASVQMYGYHHGVQSGLNGRESLIRAVLHHSPATVLITPASQDFYPDGTELYSGESLKTGRSEKDAREAIEQAQSELLKTVKGLGFSEKDASRVSLYLPAWYVSSSRN